MEVVISHCEKFSKIDENALRHLDICSVCIKHGVSNELVIIVHILA